MSLDRVLFLAFCFFLSTAHAQSPVSESIRIDVLLAEGEKRVVSGDTSAWSFVRNLSRKADSYGSVIQKAQTKLLQGELYRSRADYVEALAFFLPALADAEKEGAVALQGRLNRLTGICFRMMEDYPRALFHYTASLALYQKLGDDEGIMNAHNNMASIYFLLKDYNRADDHVNRLMDLAGQEQHVYWQTSALRLKGLIAGEKGDLVRSAELQEKALKMVKEQGPADRLLLGLTGLQLAYFKLKLYDSGLAFGREAIQRAAADSNYVSLETAFEHQALLYEASGKLDSAYWALKQRQYYRDRSISSEKARSSADLQARYELGRKETEIRTLELENELKATLLSQQQQFRNLLVMLVVLLAAFLILALNRFVLKRKTAAALHESNAKLELALSEAKQAHEKAVAASELKTELLGIAAHDLKNPLSAMLGMGELLMHGGNDETEVKNIGEQIHRSATRMYRLVADLLLAAAEDAGMLEIEHKPVRLKSVVEQVAAAQINAARRKKQAILLSLRADPILSGDAGRLAEIIENLISNAVKYSAIGGTIRITLELFNASPQKVRLCVHDSGPGIEPEQFERLFKRFSRLGFQPTGGESSTGLGLSIVRRLTELHGGTVFATSDGKGKGSTFTVELPLLHNR
jgi:signal transduction histidine kinase